MSRRCAGREAKHDPDRSAVRHGAGDGWLTLGRWRVPVQRLRMGATDGSGELPVAHEIAQVTERLSFE